MNQFLKCFVVSVLFLGVSNFAFAAERLVVNPEGARISFSGRSTLHAFEGVAPSVSGLLEAEVTSNSFEAKGNVVVDVVKLDTGNPKRDRNMKNMFNEAQFPQIVCRIDALKTVALVNDKDEGAIVQGALIIAGVEQPVEFKVSVYQDNGQWVIEGTHRISLSKYKLRPPSVIGLIRVFDTVNVDFKVAFQKE